jgi:hypothetical protein
MVTYKVVCVVEHDLTAEALDLVWSDAFECALSSNRHEDGGVDRAVREGQDSGTGLCGPAFGDNIPLEGRFHDARGNALNGGTVWCLRRWKRWQAEYRTVQVPCGKKESVAEVFGFL